VVVLDPDAETAHVFRADAPPSLLGPGDDLELLGLLNGFRVRVERFFA
jgi:hypothetical protein